jgi:hypothetical protein
VFITLENPGESPEEELLPLTLQPTHHERGYYSNAAGGNDSLPIATIVIRVGYDLEEEEEKAYGYTTIITEMKIEVKEMVNGGGSRSGVSLAF